MTPGLDIVSPYLGMKEIRLWYLRDFFYYVQTPANNTHTSFVKEKYKLAVCLPCRVIVSRIFAFQRLVGTVFEFFELW